MNASKLNIDCMAVVGIGLIGGSAAAALRNARVVRKVIGVSRNPATAQRALELGLIDKVVSLTDVVQAELILLAMPVGSTYEVLKAIEPNLLPSTIITDVGSVKQSVIDDARRALGKKINQFVAAHPIAGAETSGPDAADVNLFRQRPVVISPLPENSSQVLEIVNQLWQSCGGVIRHLDAHTHDAIYAAVSHLPHALAFAYMAQIAQSENADLKLQLAGSGFRDFTRIAAGLPEMWCDILFSNKEALLTDLGISIQYLQTLEQMIINNDKPSVHALFKSAAAVRQHWSLNKGLDSHQDGSTLASNCFPRTQ